MLVESKLHPLTNILEILSDQKPNAGVYIGICRHLMHYHIPMYVLSNRCLRNRFLWQILTQEIHQAP